MATKGPDSSFKNDSRGVSELIGFILIFAIIVILLSINQAQFVPQENREIEFQHFQEVQNDMVEVRSSISTAGQTDVSQYPTVKLGPDYPVRLLAINPPDPAGTLHTSPSYNISIETEEEQSNISTRFIEFQNGYNEMEIGSIWYENSVLYLDESGNTGEIVVIEDQNLIRGTSAVRVEALQNEYSETSTSRVTIELYPVENPELTDLNGDVTVEVPTRLNGSEYWDDELNDFDGYNGVEENGVREGVHVLNLTVEAESLKFNTVGINSAPENQGSATQGIGQEDEDNNGETGDPLPDDVVAFYDENGNSVYDAGEESYTVAELEGLSVDGTLRVVKNAVMSDGSLAGIDIDAEDIVVEPGVKMQTTGGGQTIDLTSGKTIDIDSASIQSVAPITIESGGQLTAEGAEIETTGGDGDVNLNSGDSMNINSADIQSVAPITIDAGGQLNSNSASIVATGGGSAIDIESDADIDISDAIVEGVNIDFDSSGSINLNETSLDASSWGDLNADLTGNANLYVENAEFTADGNPTNLEYGPRNSVNVIGEPAVGGTTS